MKLMARGKPTFLGWLFKWVIVPFGLAAIGFFLLGPRIGDELVERIAAEKKPQPVEPEKPKVKEPRVLIETGVEPGR